MAYKLDGHVFVAIIVDVVVVVGECAGLVVECSVLGLFLVLSPLLALVDGASNERACLGLATVLLFIILLGWLLSLWFGLDGFPVAVHLWLTLN